MFIKNFNSKYKGISSEESLVLNRVGRNKLQFSPLYVQQYCTKM